MGKIVIVTILIFLTVLIYFNNVASAQLSQIPYVNTITTNSVNNDLSFNYSRSVRLPSPIDINLTQATVSYDSNTKNYTVSDPVHYYQKQINNIQETKFRTAISSAGFFDMDTILTKLGPEQRELNITLGERTHKVVWSDGTQLPSEFTSLLSVLLNRELTADPCEWACPAVPFIP